MDSNLNLKIDFEISQIDKLLEAASPLLALCKIKELDFTEMSAVAMTLHQFYTGVENVIAMVLKSGGEKLPTDSRWHQTLLDISFGDNDRGLKIFRDEIKEPLSGYLKFRHFVRHSYTYRWDWTRMAPLTENLPDLWAAVKADLQTFLTNK